MLYIIPLFVMTLIGPDQYAVKKFAKYEVFSDTPIIECTGEVVKKIHSNERMMVHYCETEKLYYFMTGTKYVKIVTEGINNA